MKDVNYIIKRVVIGVLIALILMLLRGSLFLKVSAKTTITGGLAIATPSGTTLENYDDVYFTNIDYDPTSNYRDITGLSYSFIENNGNSYGYFSRLPDLNENVSMTGNSHGSTIINFSINFLQGSNHLELDKNYSIALKFTKSTDISWSELTTDLQYYSFTSYGKNINDTTFNLLDSSFIIIDDVAFYTYQTNNSATNNGVFIVNFHTSSDNYLYSYDDITLTSFTYSRYGTSTPDFSNSGNFYPAILNNTSSTKTFTNKTLYFIQGSLLPYGEWCTDNGFHVGCGITGDNPFPDSSGMDVIHDTDIEVIDDLPQCSPTDIPCHINRVVKSIQDLFIRFGNFFRDFINNLYKTFTDLFVPSSDYITDYINDSISLLRQKLGFLEYPIELLVSLLTRFNSLTKQTSFSYSGFTYPGTNTQIIPSFSFDFDTITNDNSYIAQMYSYYFILINGFLCLCFIRLCRKKLISFGLGG